MMKLKTLLTSLIFCCIITVFDILMVEELFRPLALWSEIHVYHQALWCFLVPCLIAFISVLTKNVFFAAYSIVMCYCGLEDILYFVFQLKMPPQWFTWLNFPHSCPHVLELLALSLSLIIVIYVAERMVAKRG